VVLRVKTFIFKEHNLVILLCPRINNCPYFCRTYKKYERQGFDIVCLNTDYYKERDIPRVLEEEVRKRRELKNRLRF